MPPSSAQAYSTLQNFGNTMVKPEDAIAQGSQQYGVSGLQSQLQALRTMTGNLQTGINNVDPSVTGRTQGGLVTEAQRSAIVNKERAPLVTQFNDASTHLDDTNKQYTDAEGLASNYANALLTGQQQKYSSLLDQYKTSLSSEQDAAKQAEAAREFNASLADQKAARAASAGGGLDLSPLLASSAPSAAAASVGPTAPAKTINDDIGRAFQNFQNQPKGYTESTIIPAIANEYYHGDQKAAASAVYTMRKKLGFG